MNKSILFVVVMALLISANVAFADGKFYAREKIPPGIPYQRALILFDGNQETLILQSKYQLQEIEKDTFLGWVVPVPNVPDLASMPANQAGSLFFRLGMMSRPKSISIAFFGLIILFVLLIIALLLYLLSLFLPQYRVRRYLRKSNCIRYIFYAFLASLIFALLIPSLGKARGMGGIDVLKAEKVGIYDVQVVKSDRPDKLIKWLNENNFHFEESDREVFNDYIKRKWCFVVAQIETTEDLESREVISEGLVAPLILKFKTDRAVYPLSLTSTTGQDTQVLIYILSNNKMQCSDRMKLLYAGKGYEEILDGLKEDFTVEPQGFFSEEEVSLPFICKFKSTLAPSQMKEDLIFSDATDNKPYREKVIRW